MTDDIPAAMDLAALSVLAALLLAIGIVDARTQRIPNRLTGALLVAGIAASGLTGEPGLLASTAGAALGGLFLLAVLVGFRRWRGQDGLGLGDVKFLVGAGAWVGWQGIGPVVFVAAATALAVAGLRARGTPLDRQARIAFGPYLAGALLAVKLWQAFGSVGLDPADLG